jgi:hypothetical protein
MVERRAPRPKWFFPVLILFALWGLSVLVLIQLHVSDRRNVSRLDRIERHTVLRD